MYFTWLLHRSLSFFEKIWLFHENFAKNQFQKNSIKMGQNTPKMGQNTPKSAKIVKKPKKSISGIYLITPHRCLCSNHSIFSTKHMFFNFWYPPKSDGVGSPLNPMKFGITYPGFTESAVLKTVTQSGCKLSNNKLSECFSYMLYIPWICKWLTLAPPCKELNMTLK